MDHELEDAERSVEGFAATRRPKVTRRAFVWPQLSEVWLTLAGARFIWVSEADGGPGALDNTCDSMNRKTGRCRRLRHARLYPSLGWVCAYVSLFDGCDRRHIGRPSRLQAFDTEILHAAKCRSGQCGAREAALNLTRTGSPWRLTSGGFVGSVILTDAQDRSGEERLGSHL